MSEAQENLDAALAGAVKTAKDTGTFARAPISCKCGRYPRINPETGKLTKHKIGKEHPGFPGMSHAKRLATWCPEVTE
jgi:hypothetical protein